MNATQAAPATDTVAAPDYPAAHSHDTTWFAVDQAGRVGIFFTGEDGPSPLSAGDGNLLHVLQDLRGVRDDDDVLEDDFDEMEEQAADLGLYLYEYIGEFGPLVRPYSYRWMPGTPRHVEQLPPGLREQFKRVRFEGIDFPNTDIIQLAEHMPRLSVYFYYDTSVAYLAADEKTVRPIPGKEEQFAAFVATFRQNYPERTGLVFDPEQPESPLEPPKPRRRRKKEE
jgi:hypothetical protein